MDNGKKSVSFHLGLQFILCLDIIFLFLYLSWKEPFYLSPVVGSGLAIAASLVFILKQHQYQDLRLSILEQQPVKPQEIQQSDIKDKINLKKELEKQQQEHAEEKKLLRCLQINNTQIQKETKVHMEKIDTTLQSLEQSRQENKNMHTKIHRKIDTLKKEQAVYQDSVMEIQKKDQEMQRRIQKKIETLEKEENQSHGKVAELQDKMNILQKKQEEHQVIYTQTQKQGQELQTQIQEQIETLQKLQKQQQDTDIKTQQQIASLQEEEKKQQEEEGKQTNSIHATKCRQSRTWFMTCGRARTNVHHLARPYTSNNVMTGYSLAAAWKLPFMP